MQKVHFWVHKGRKDNGGIEPGAEGLKAGLWDHRHHSHLPPHCSIRVLSQGTRGQQQRLTSVPYCTLFGVRNMAAPLNRNRFILGRQGPHASHLPKAKVTEGRERTAPSTKGIWTPK